MSLLNTGNISISKRNDFNGKPGVNNLESNSKTGDSHDDKLGNYKNVKSGTVREKNIAKSKSVTPGSESWGSPIENEDLDSASVLRQSHKEITNFVANSSESPAIYEKCVNKPVMQNDNSFDMVSSKLAEAMVMFSE
ncbi:hypothetical protein Ddye_000272 [Dipteronia dyeriana]|uniref:Uncharacterized protein n=1 Tax=Dipteronia dyeriana TaxID=168575 RepID=A0AAD9XLX7_9ROSI|nr:hypothetical protein Ddye_000272 [Dipteronia dyeriana]